MKSIRLNKALAQAGVCSRRKADEYIADGRVFVNGNMVTEMGFAIDPEKDAVTVDGRVVDVSPPVADDFVYVMLHKPIQVVSTAKDPQGRQTVLDILPEEFRARRIYPIGRLDYFSEGLLLLSNDGDLTYRLSHPKYHLPKVYHVQMREVAAPPVLERMRKGMTLHDGTRLAPIGVKRLSEDGRLLELTLHQGINRQIRRMCADLNLTILKLVRVQIGPLFLGDLPKGRARELTAKELAALRQAAGGNAP